MLKAFTLIRLRVSRLWKVMFLISTIATSLAYGWWHFDILEMSDDERNAYDDGLKKFNNKWWFPPGQMQRNDEILLLAIDDDTFSAVSEFEPWRERYGSWPYDRLIWSDVLEYLSEAGAKSVVMDVTLSEPRSDPTGDLKLGETLAAVTVPVHMGFNAIQRVTPLPAVDKPENRIHVAIEKPPPPVKDGGDGEDTFGGDDGAFPEEKDAATQAKEREAALVKQREHAAAAYAFPVTYAAGIEAVPFPPVPALVLLDGGTPTPEDVRLDAGVTTVDLPRFPVPAIDPVLGAMAGFGTVELEADEDGKMRSVQFAYTDGTNQYVTLAVSAAADLWGAKEVKLEPGFLRIGDHSARINQDGSAGINYFGKLKQRFDTVSLADVLRYQFSEDPKQKQAGYRRFKDKIIFIGAIAQGTGDQKPTPFEAAEPGVMKHMSVLDNIMHDRFVIEAPFWLSLLVAFGVALFSVALVLVVQSVVTDIGAPVLLYFFFFIVTGGFLSLTHWHVLSSMPSMAGTLAAVAATTFSRFIASEDRDFLRRAFSSYMESDLVEQMVEGRQLPPLDGEERVITAFFSDIKGFSTISEQFKDEPKKLMVLLNRYLSAVTPIIKAEGACIDKYIGDSVVALFGAPIPHDDHALRACKAALKVQTAVTELGRVFEKEGLPPLVTRIGINTDQMLVGNIGSDELLDYTALGDGMNLASRLEGANKAFDSLILVGPNTYEATKGQVVMRELDNVRVAGRHDAITVYELVGLNGQVPAPRLQVLELYAKALELFRFRRFADALKVLKDAHDLDRADGPVRVLAAKSHHFMQHPPREDWDGVTQLEK